MTDQGLLQDMIQNPEYALGLIVVCGLLGLGLLSACCAWHWNGKK